MCHLNVAVSLTDVLAMLKIFRPRYVNSTDDDNDDSDNAYKSFHTKAVSTVTNIINCLIMFRDVKRRSNLKSLIMFHKMTTETINKLRENIQNKALLGRVVIISH